MPKLNTIFLKEKGYIINVSRFGRLGNSLLRLRNVLLLAKNTESIIRIRNQKKISQINSGAINIPSKIDFRSKKNKNCNKIINVDLLFREPYDENLFIEKENWCSLYLNELILKKDVTHLVNDDTLVIHIRSGDIMKNGRHNQFYQPPLCYYKSIIKLNDYSDILIVSEKDRSNPVINELVKWNKNIKTSDGDILEDVNCLLSAKHVILSRSSFGRELVRISNNLKYLYRWDECVESKWEQWNLYPDDCLSDNVKVIRYYTENYIGQDDWGPTESQLKLMITYPENELIFNEEFEISIANESVMRKRKHLIGKKESVTFCQVLREVYYDTKNESIKLNCRKAVGEAKRIVFELKKCKSLYIEEVKEMGIRKHKPVSIKKIEKTRYKGHHTICQFMRDIYAMTENEDIKMKCRIGMSMAKSMHERLKKYRKMMKAKEIAEAEGDINQYQEEK